MPVKCSDIIKFMETFAPLSLAEQWDNPGLLVGRRSSDVKKILIALDAADEVVDEAAEGGFDMIITHHPLIFNSIKAVNDDTNLGRRIIRLIENDISVFCAHTNVDVSVNGTNAVLAKLIGLEDTQGLVKSGESSTIGLVGRLNKPMSFETLAQLLKGVLNISVIMSYKANDKMITTVGLCTGKASGGEYMTAAAEKGCDAYITGDVGYHDAQCAQQLGLNLFDATHYASEIPVLPVICSYLNDMAVKFKLDFKCFVSGADYNTLKPI